MHTFLCRIFATGITAYKPESSRPSPCKIFFRVRFQNPVAFNLSTWLNAWLTPELFKAPLFSNPPVLRAPLRGAPSRTPKQDAAGERSTDLLEGAAEEINEGEPQDDAEHPTLPQQPPPQQRPAGHHGAQPPAGHGSTGPGPASPATARGRREARTGAGEGSGAGGAPRRGPAASAGGEAEAAAGRALRGRGRSARAAPGPLGWEPAAACGVTELSPRFLPPRLPAQLGGKGLACGYVCMHTAVFIGICLWVLYAIAFIISLYKCFSKYINLFLTHTAVYMHAVKAERSPAGVLGMVR